MKSIPVTKTGTREIALDTETTGLDAEGGDRIIEIGAVEMIDNVRTGREYHAYIDPQCDITVAAQEIHGITKEMLEGKPVFADIVEEFLDFIAGDPLVIHNADFDTKFLNKEMERLGRPAIDPSRVIDSLKIARRAFPGAKLSLDALCRRFRISLEGREKHGALLDAQLLGDVYLELNGGRQRALELLSQSEEDVNTSGISEAKTHRQLHVLRATEEELAAHAALLGKISNPVWNRVAGK